MPQKKDGTCQSSQRDGGRGTTTTRIPLLFGVRGIVFSAGILLFLSPSSLRRNQHYVEFTSSYPDRQTFARYLLFPRTPTEAADGDTERASGKDLNAKRRLRSKGQTFFNASKVIPCSRLCIIYVCCVTVQFGGRIWASGRCFFAPFLFPPIGLPPPLSSTHQSPPAGVRAKRGEGEEGSVIPPKPSPSTLLPHPATKKGRGGLNFP